MRHEPVPRNVPCGALLTATHYSVLTAILIGAAVLRFWDIPHAGIFGMDEARYLLDSYGKSVELRGIFGLFAGKWAEMRGGPSFELAPYLTRLHAEMTDAGVFFPKTLFYYFVGATMLATGFVTWAGAFVESLFGVLGVVAAYVFARRAAGRNAALMAAFLIAFSCFHVYNSRTAYPQTMPMFFATIAFACQVRWASRAGRLRWLFAAGFFLGVAFWGGYQAAALVAPAALAHTLLCARMRPAAQAFRCFWGGGLLYVAGFLLAMGLAEATSYPLILLFRSQCLGYPHPTFLEVNFPRWMYHGSQPAHLSGLLVLPYFLGLYEGYGALCALLFLAGMGAWAWSRHGAPALRSGRADGYVLLALVALPGIVAYATFAVKGVLVVRAYLYALPFFVTAIAALTMAAWESPSPMRAASRIVIATGLALAAISSSFGIREVLQMRSGYPSVAAYCMEIGARPAPGPDSLILECYLRAAAASSPPDGAMELAAYDLSELCVSLYPDEVAARRRASAFRKEFRQSVGRLLVETEGIEFYGDPLPALLRAHRLDLVRASRIMTYQMFPAEELRGDSFGGTP